MQVTSSGKVRRSESEWRAIFKRWEQSGVSRIAYCKQEEISKASFSEELPRGQILNNENRQFPIDSLRDRCPHRQLADRDSRGLRKDSSISSAATGPAPASTSIESLE